jgi:pyruvate dehydrogenase E2 component (dihydrolipoyllysine-residue acetyltransferase)
MTDVIMPQMGESIAEGTVIKWYKKVGDRVERDEPLFEISTDKVDTEIPSPSTGILAEIRVTEGQTVPINTVVAVIGDKVAEVAKPEQAQAQPPQSTASPVPPAPTVAASVVPPPPTAPPPPTPPTSSSSSAPPSVTPQPVPAAETAGDEAGARGPRSSPLVRKMAIEHGIDLSEITGSGEEGRITKNDVERYLESRSRAAGKPAPAPVVAPPKATPTAEPLPLPLPISIPKPKPAPTPTARGASPTPVTAPAAAQPVPVPSPAPARAPAPRPAAPPTSSGRVTIEPMSILRKSIAEHMVLSRRTSAHVTTVFEADVSRVVEARESSKRLFEREEGVKLTFTPFFVRAVTGALKSFPLLNASIDGDNIVFKKDLNIGIAVSLDGGLIVPVIQHADEKSFLGLARAVSDLAERARTKKLKPEEVQGGTFTLTNPGPFGALFGTPIINQPQVAILGVGGIHKRPVVIHDAIAVRSMVYLALTFDHRLIDGALADQFMADVKRRLETWDEKIT